MGSISPVAVLASAVLDTWPELGHRHGVTGRAGSIGR